MNKDDYLRSVIHYFNLKYLSEVTGIGYSTLKNWKHGSQQLSERKKDCLIQTIKNIPKYRD